MSDDEKSVEQLAAEVYDSYNILSPQDENIRQLLESANDELLQMAEGTYQAYIDEGNVPDSFTERVGNDEEDIEKLYDLKDDVISREIRRLQNVQRILPIIKKYHLTTSKIGLLTQEVLGDRLKYPTDITPTEPEIILENTYDSLSTIMLALWMAEYQVRYVRKQYYENVEGCVYFISKTEIKDHHVFRRQRTNLTYSSTVNMCSNFGTGLVGQFQGNPVVLFTESPVIYSEYFAHSAVMPEMFMQKEVAKLAIGMVDNKVQQEELHMLKQDNDFLTKKDEEAQTQAVETITLGMRAHHESGYTPKYLGGGGAKGWVVAHVNWLLAGMIIILMATVFILILRINSLTGGG